jgi:hypothetical protein
MHTTEVILFFALRFSCMHGVVEFVSTLQKGLIVLCVWKRRGVTYWFHAYQCVYEACASTKECPVLKLKDPVSDRRVRL